MKTITCDRCGMTFEKNKPIKGYKYTIINHSMPDVEVDLCDKCREQFLIWLGVKDPQSIYDRQC